MKNAGIHFSVVLDIAICSKLNTTLRRMLLTTEGLKAIMLT